MIRDDTCRLQRLMPTEQRADRAQGFDRHRGHFGDPEPACCRIGHPARDAEIDAVWPADRDRDVCVARRAHHLEWRTGEGMEGVVDGDARRWGIVRCCS
jgi:hypothetical protein